MVVAAAAASTVMGKIHSSLKMEVKDIFKEEMVDMVGVGSEVAVGYVQATVELEEVEVTLEEMVELMNSFPVGEGEDLLTVGQISTMNVVSIPMNMVE